MVEGVFSGSLIVMVVDTSLIINIDILYLTPYLDSAII
jgi:hypothetical protein